MLVTPPTSTSLELSTRRWPSSWSRSVRLGDRHRLDDHPLRRLAGATARRLDRLHRLLPLHDLAEERVLRRQAHPVLAADDEELAAVGVRAGVGHGQRAD